MSGGSHDAVLVIAFGGPENLEEVRPFLRRVLAGRPVPEARFEEVAHHYAVIGGRSPLPELTRAQVQLLEQELARRGITAPVVLGMRNSAPLLADALSELGARGCQRVLGVIMAAHEGPASHGRYREAIDAARKQLAEAGTAVPEVRYTSGFHLHPGFVTAHVERVRAALARAVQPAASAPRPKLIFTAHSVPVPTAVPYAQQIAESARAIAAELGAVAEGYRIAYQSRSGAPKDPWLEPDVNAVIREEAAAGTRALLLSPLGFLCDHVEVLYDLDVEAVQTAEDAGVVLARAAAPNDHLGLIQALADRVSEAMLEP